MSARSVDLPRLRAAPVCDADDGGCRDGAEDVGAERDPAPPALEIAELLRSGRGFIVG
ncbi:MAG: hypothetical protein ACF8R7_16890 [Phycisphaerales bacterium JB039]